MNRPGLAGEAREFLLGAASILCAAFVASSLFMNRTETNAKTTIAPIKMGNFPAFDSRAFSGWFGIWK